MALHERSIVGCTQSDFTAPADCRLTQNGDRLNIHLFNWPYRHLHFDALAGKIEYAQLLHDGSEVTWLRPSANTLWANTQFPVGDDQMTFVLRCAGLRSWSRSSRSSSRQGTPPAFRIKGRRTIAQLR